MTLLVDPPLLLGGGYALGRHIEDERLARTAGTALAGTVLATSVATYMNSEVMRPVWERLGGRTGQDLILNSRVLSFDYERLSPAANLVVAAAFASYPCWALIGVALGRRARRR